MKMFMKYLKLMPVEHYLRKMWYILVNIFTVLLMEYALVGICIIIKKDFTLTYFDEILKAVGVYGSLLLGLYFGVFIYRTYKNYTYWKEYGMIYKIKKYSVYAKNDIYDCKGNVVYKEDEEIDNIEIIDPTTFNSYHLLPCGEYVLRSNEK